jgi:hypothetical protein
MIDKYRPAAAFDALHSHSIQHFRRRFTSIRPNFILLAGSHFTCTNIDCFSFTTIPAFINSLMVVSLFAAAADDYGMIRRHMPHFIIKYHFNIISRSISRLTLFTHSILIYFEHSCLALCFTTRRRLTFAISRSHSHVRHERE